MGASTARARRTERPPRRWRVLAGGGLAAGAALLVIWAGDAGLYRDRVDATLWLAGLCAVGGLAWLWAGAGLTGGARLAAAGALIGGLAVAGLGLRLEGFRLDGVPLLARRGAPEAGADLPGPHPDPWSDLRRPPAPPEGPLLDDWRRHRPVRRWRVEVGAGVAGFAVAEGRAITQEQRGPLECVVAYDLERGEELWVHGERARFDSRRAGLGPRATPVIGAGRVHALGATGWLRCLELATGRLLWRRRVDAAPAEGLWAAPLFVAGPRARVVVSGGPGGGLHAFAAATGEPLWSAPGAEAGQGQPVVAPMPGGPQIVVAAPAGASGHDPRSGRRLWRWGRPDDPVSWLTPPPVPLGVGRLLLAGDRSGATALDISPHQGAGGFVPAVEWRSRGLRPILASVVRHGDQLYGLDDGTLVCLEADTGFTRWRGPRYGPGRLLDVGAGLLVQTESGLVVLVAFDRDRWVERGRVQAVSGRRVWAPPTRAGERLLVRARAEAACWILPTGAAPAGKTPAGRPPITEGDIP